MTLLTSGYIEPAVAVLVTSNFIPEGQEFLLLFQQNWTLLSPDILYGLGPTQSPISHRANLVGCKYKKKIKPNLVDILVLRFSLHVVERNNDSFVNIEEFNLQELQWSQKNVIFFPLSRIKKNWLIMLVKKERYCSVVCGRLLFF